MPETKVETPTTTIVKRKRGRPANTKQCQSCGKSISEKEYGTCSGYCKKCNAQKESLQENERAGIEEKTENNERPDEPKPPVKVNLVRNMVDSYYDVQRLRIATEHRLDKIGKAEIVADQHIMLLTKTATNLRAEEKALGTALEEWVRTQPISGWLLAQRGIGKILCANMLAYLDIHKARHISSFWKFAGLYPGAKLEKGKKAPFSRGFRVACYKVGVQMLMQKNPIYVPIYEDKKAEYLKREGITKGHADMMARRYMVKRFLADLWLAWRNLENLPVSDPYVVAILGHDKEESAAQPQA